MTIAPADAPLVVRTLPIAAPEAAGEPLGLLDLLPPTGPLAWVRRGEGLVGWGCVARIDLPERPPHGTDPDAPPDGSRFDQADLAWSEVVDSALVRDEVGLPGTGLVAFGSFSFAAHSPAGSTLVVPEVVVGRRGDRWWLTTVRAGGLPPPPDLPAVPPVRPVGPVRFADGALSPPEWTATVADAIARIGRGEVEKVVLARDLIAQFDRPLDVRAPLHRLAERFPGCWTFTVDGLLGATPELLVRREKGLVTSRVLAGTIRRTGNDAQDLVLSASLAHSSKDLEEHEYAVRSVAEAIGPHCSSINVPEAPSVLHLANVMHLATDVTGVLAQDVSALALARTLHPSAAVCGTPTPGAAGLLEHLERMDRDRYAGPVGWIDAQGDGEWGIALRSGRVSADERQVRLFAGCGIVAGSDPQDELAESVAKLVPMRDALA